MDVEKIVDWADELMLAKTGSHFNNLEQAVLTGVWNNQKYREIAEEYHCTEANVKRVAGELYKFLSEELEEKVNKSNLRAAMERYYISNSSVGNFAQSKIFGSEIHLCSKSGNSDKNGKKELHSIVNQPNKIHDRTHIPKYDRLYPHRTEELNTLKHWILNENSAIITIYGLSGMGKTALATQVVDEIAEHFDRLIWYSHRTFPNLNALTTGLIQFLSQGETSEHRSLLDYLRSHRCFIILDDFHETLTPGELVGRYLPEYQNYGKLLQDIGRSPHNSCILLLSWEQPPEIATLEAENRPGHSLLLSGSIELAQEILQNRGLNDPEQWLELINRYSQNPSWLNIIAATIQDLFNGSVVQFLSYSQLFLGDIEIIIRDHYERLSASEKSLLSYLAHQEYISDLSNLPSEPFPSDLNLLATIYSLRKRGFIQKSLDSKHLQLILEPVIKHYSALHGNDKQLERSPVEIKDDQRNS
ncbi:NB-ARC domain-containing protein [Roseofilum reptotaenium CS-1145]|uniref:Uncharacterized protein n=1 Tax=Roseofilum reptotaenium AO1-A TaxID=1925591 RepID=A0A1L9QY40_9CYAN|nr:NB-ARC domain-containing protein [Roseofilum reptotaenium]MDB9519969.1 NB-ARC domain-containing protein [Roseofilum reptotaenium CS-1145]OJJ27583.1 hypothetical protein BI308_01050 [Roseofilum reptotaenium AO1-A]